METPSASTRTASRPYHIFDPYSLGNAIRYSREDFGLTQAEFAQEIGVSRRYLNALENGLETEHIRVVFRALRALHKWMAIHEA